MVGFSCSQSVATYNYKLFHLLLQCFDESAIILSPPVFPIDSAFGFPIGWCNEIISMVLSFFLLWLPVSLVILKRNHSSCKLTRCKSSSLCIQNNKLLNKLYWILWTNLIKWFWYILSLPTQICARVFQGILIFRRKEQ